MKIVCDCGNETPFEIIETEITYDDSLDATVDWKKFNFVAEHDEFWIGCKECRKSIRVIV